MSAWVRCMVCGRIKPPTRFSDPEANEMCYLCERLEEGGFLVEDRGRVTTVQRAREQGTRERIRAIRKMARGG